MIETVKQYIPGMTTDPGYPVRKHRVTTDVELSSGQVIPAGATVEGELRHYDSGINRDELIADYREHGDWAVLSGDLKREVVSDDKADHVGVIPGEFVQHPYPDESVVLLAYRVSPTG